MSQLEEVRARIEEALGMSGDFWLDEAVRVIKAHRALIDKRRVYDVSSVGARLRTAREIVGLTQLQLADRLTIAQELVSKCEREKGDIPGELFPRWCLVLGVTQAWMLGDSDVGGPPMPGAILRRQKFVNHADRTAKQRKQAKAKAERERIQGIRGPLKPRKVAPAVPEPPPHDPCPRCGVPLYEPDATFCIEDGCGWPGARWAPDVGARSQFVSGTQPE